ncbi:hypothetical protein C2G38_2200444 [Gigaspora rosea]|uniref:Uncharacterized protein n=1 Tax=Gigaspora rosea TaxID=44941 RepID=A0A397UQD4_9GLOM|nr:hypothetical protein C2G38_2200444 [Gigaspora rosea]
MEYLELTSSFNDVVLPTAWDMKNNSQSINIDSSGLKMNYTDKKREVIQKASRFNKYLDDREAAIIQANHPIP